MTTEAVNRLIDKYMEGRTSPDEERRLALEVNRADAPAEWQVVGEMLGELTLGEAVYEQTMAQRRRRRVALYVGWAAAACVAIMVVMGTVWHRQPQRQVAVELAQNAPTADQTVVVTTPVEVQREAATPVVKAVAQTPKAKPRRMPRTVTPPAPVAEEEERVTAEPPAQPTAPVSEAELAQVEQNFRQWQLEWAIRNEAIELEIATEQLNRKYAMYLAEQKNSIEI